MARSKPAKESIRSGKRTSSTRTQASLKQLKEAAEVASGVFGERGSFWTELYPGDAQGEKNARRRARAMRKMKHLTRLEKRYWPGAMAQRWVLDIARQIIPGMIVVHPSCHKPKRKRTIHERIASAARRQEKARATSGLSTSPARRRR